MNRRSFAFRGILASGVSITGSSLATEPTQGQFYFFTIQLCLLKYKVFFFFFVFFSLGIGMERLPFKPEGYNFWTWRGHKIHYVVQGEGLPIVLIHGFGASSYHWRYFILRFYHLF